MSKVFCLQGSMEIYEAVSGRIFSLQCLRYYAMQLWHCMMSTKDEKFTGKADFVSVGHFIALKFSSTDFRILRFRTQLGWISIHMMLLVKVINLAWKGCLKRSDENSPKCRESRHKIMSKAKNHHLEGSMRMRVPAILALFSPSF